MILKNNNINLIYTHFHKKGGRGGRLKKVYLLLGNEIHDIDYKSSNTNVFFCRHTIKI